MTMSKKAHLNVKVSQEWMNDLNNYLKHTGVSKSEFIRRAVQEKMSKEQ